MTSEELRLLPAEDLKKRLKWKCPLAGHSKHDGVSHSSCYQKLHTVDFGERIGFLDIETTDLNADYGIITCYCLKDSRSPKIYEATITLDDIHKYSSKKRDVEPKEDTRIIHQLVEDLKNFDRLVLHYGCGFDLPFIRTRAVICGVDYPTFGVYVMSDTWVMLKKKFKLSRNSLENGCRKLVGTTLKDHLSMSIKHGALRGEKWAIDCMLVHCFTPDHKVLMGDLKYEKIENIKVGDKLLAFDENGPNRKYKESFVEKICFEEEEVYEVLLSDGKIFKVTGNHLWLVKSGNSYRWLKTTSLSTEKNNPKFCSKIDKLFEEWNTDTSWEGGYLSGVFDGEGSLYQGSKNSKNLHLDLSFAQRDNACLEKALECLKKFTKNYHIHPVVLPTHNGLGKKDCLRVNIQGGRPGVLALLGTIRPPRILGKLDLNKLGRMERRLGINESKIVEVRKLDKRVVGKIQTSTKTLIVEGYPHHNCRKDVIDTEALYTLINPYSRKTKSFI